MANNLKDHLKEVADAIRAKKGTTDLINPQDFATEIEGISGGGSGGESNITYYRYDRDNALSVWKDNGTEFTVLLYANIIAGLDIVGITTGGSLETYAQTVYTALQDVENGKINRIALSYISTTPNAIFRKANSEIAAMVTNMHDFIRAVGTEILPWSDEQVNAAVALFTEITEDEFMTQILSTK